MAGPEDQGRSGEVAPAASARPVEALGGARSEALTRLAERRFDLLVIGGGIIGAGIAASAASHGLAVALVERGDFGGATSSASSKLIHGGLRYLRQGQLSLVRESQRERRALMETVAPHLVTELPFVLPLYAGGPYGPARLGAGLALYAALAGRRPTRLLTPQQGARLVPPLRLDGLRRCGLYRDCVTNDARLTLANVCAAAEAGAVVLNGAEVVALRTRSGRVCGAELACAGALVAVDARVVVNATGPWLDQLRRLEDPAAGRSVRLSKGVHLVVELELPWQAALAIPQDGSRVTFAVPWQGRLLLGTTDELYEGEPELVEVSQRDREQVLAEAGRAVAGDLLAPDRVRAQFAGLRVLPLGKRATAAAARETLYLRGRGGMLSVAGGKLTTYRAIAREVLVQLRSELGLPALGREALPLPDARGLDQVVLPASLSAPTRATLRALYGSRAATLVALAAEEPGLLEPLAPGLPELAVQVVYAARYEWARGVEDVLARRTTLALRGEGSAAVRARVAELLAREAGKVRLGVE